MTKITWGIHKELFAFLTTDENFSNLFYEPKIAEEALMILLSDRDAYGEVTTKANLNTYTMETLQEHLNMIGDYFTDFFFHNRQRMMDLSNKMMETPSK